MNDHHIRYLSKMPGRNALETGGSQLGSDRVVTGVPLKDGVYSVRLDASAIEFNRQVWLETAVTDETGDNPTTLTPRTQLTAVPYAFHAFNAGESGSGWSLIGNSGTAPGTNFIGTTDNTAIEFRVQNRRALQIKPGGEDGSGDRRIPARRDSTGHQRRGRRLALRVHERLNIRPSGCRLPYEANMMH